MFVAEKNSQSMFGTWIWSRHRQPLAEHRRPTRDLPPAAGGTSKGLYLGYNQRNMCREITKDYDMYNHNSSTIEFRG